MAVSFTLEPGTESVCCRAPVPRPPAPMSPTLMTSFDGVWPWTARAAANTAAEAPMLPAVFRASRRDRLGAVEACCWGMGLTPE